MHAEAWFGAVYSMERRTIAKAWAFGGGGMEGVCTSAQAHECEVQNITYMLEFSLGRESES